MPRRPPPRPAPPRPAPPRPASPTPAERRLDSIADNDRAFQLLEQGRFRDAYELARGALARLGGVAPHEAYANYNVGASLLGVGRCAEAIPYLDRSEQLQGQRDEIDTARAEARACVGGGDGDGDDKGDGDGGKGRGKGNGKPLCSFFPRAGNVGQHSTEERDPWAAP